VTATFRGVIERGTLRTMVPFDLSYDCTRHGAAHPATGMAIFDTGSPYTLIPSTALPEGHVTWEDLDVTGNRMRSRFGDREYRWWYVDVTVLGVTVAKRVKVAEGGFPDVPIFGMEDMGKAFRVGIDWGNPAGPRFHLDPYAPSAALVAPEPEYEPVAMQDMDLIRYHDQHYRLSQDLASCGFVRDWPFLPPARVQVDAPAMPRIVPRNRQLRRAAARRS
jgi:hypothetical protein